MKTISKLVIKLIETFAIYNEVYEAGEWTKKAGTEYQLVPCYHDDAFSAYVLSHPKEFRVTEHRDDCPTIEYRDADGWRPVGFIDGAKTSNADMISRAHAIDAANAVGLRFAD